MAHGEESTHCAASNMSLVQLSLFASISFFDNFCSGLLVLFREAETIAVSCVNRGRGSFCVCAVI